MRIQAIQKTTPAENEGESRQATTQNTNTANTAATNTDKTQETEAAPTAASVQNTAQNTDTNTAAPQTGDSGNVAVWTMLLMFSAGGSGYSCSLQKTFLLRTDTAIEEQSHYLTDII